MDRRTFLRATVTTAGGVALGIGCSDDTTNTTDTGADASSDLSGGQQLEPGEAFFPQSLASGDPKASSVILWTRVEDAEQGASDLSLTLQVALDGDFSQLVQLDGGTDLVVTAEAAFDHCVKVKLTSLDAATQYFYRFIYTTGDVAYVSRVGRAKTAPAADADVPVTFSVANCQDYNGKYYNSYRRMLQQDLDFFVHLGDYVYETTGDPQFQERSPGRVVTFSDEDGAIVFHEGTETEYFAAKSLSNYRELYKTYRSDPDLQATHEAIPMIAIWDDHEFSDDSWGANATYFDGEGDELDVERRKAANQAWFEYMPVDYMDDEAFRYDSGADFPGDLNIYRDLEYGSHLHLMMTDLRTYRSDHLIPEDAFPGALAMTEEELIASEGAVPDFAGPYVNIDTYAEGVYKTALQGAATAGGYLAENVTGNISVAFINKVVEDINEASEGDEIPLISEEDQTDLPRGLAFTNFMKISQFGQIGSRYFCIKDAFEVYARYRFQETNGASETAMGDDQESWFLETMRDSTKTWKVWGNEFCLIPRIVDLSSMVMLPEAFRNTFQLSAEDWDGMPNRRDALLTALSEVGNVVAITGDIHAFFAGTPWVSDDRSKRIVEFVTGAISSSTYQVLLANSAASDPALREAGAAALAVAAAEFIADEDTQPNPHLGYLDIVSHGFSKVTVSSDKLEVEFHFIDQRHVTEQLSDDDLDAKFSVERFKVDIDSAEIYRDFDGSWRRWDPDAFDWV